MRIRRQLVASTKNISTHPNTKKYLTIHGTGNTGNGANAAAHANLQSRPNPRVASWHWTVDDKEAVQSFPHDVRTFHAGTARGNREAISVEICMNRDGNLRQMVINGAQLAAYILDQEKMRTSQMNQHNFWTGKDCPQQIRHSTAGINWASFVTLVSQFRGKSIEDVGYDVPVVSKVDKKYQEALAFLGNYDGQIDGEGGPLWTAAVKEYQQDNNLHPDGDFGSITTKHLEKNMAKIDDVLSDLQEIKRTLQPGIPSKRTDGEFASFMRPARSSGDFTGKGRPDSIATEVGHLKTKAARQDLIEVHFTHAGHDGWCVWWPKAGQWAECPDADTWKRHNDILKFIGLAGTLSVRTWDDILSDAKINGGPDVFNPAAFAPQVPWNLVPKTGDDSLPVEDEA